MDLDWIHENPAYWDDAKKAVVGGAGPGVFDVGARAVGDVLPGEWWRVERDGRAVAFGWMDVNWGDAEVLLAVARDARAEGIGTHVLDRLEAEARARGLNYLYNVVRATHPDRERVTRWLEARRFRRSDEGVLKRAVGRG